MPAPNPTATWAASEADATAHLYYAGCSRRWLEVERHRPGTKLIASYLNSKPTYSRASLLAIKAARTVTPHQS